MKIVAETHICKSPEFCNWNSHSCIHLSYCCIHGRHHCDLFGVILKAVTRRKKRRILKTHRCIMAWNIAKEVTMPTRMVSQRFLDFHMKHFRKPKPWFDQVFENRRKHNLFWHCQGFPIGSS